MKEHFTLSIPAPCHENWNNFKPTKKGGYCQSCRKEVVDFTTWSDAAIIEFFRSNQGVSTCGRLRKQQLKNYPITDSETSKFLPASLLGAALAFASLNAHATEGKTLVETWWHESSPANHEAFPIDSLGRKKIKGVVLDEENSPMPGVNIVLKGSNTSTVSDGDGQFSLEVNYPKETDTLVFSFIGFETLEIPIGETNHFTLNLKPDLIALGEPIIVGGICANRWTPRGIWWRLRNLFR